MKEMIKRNILLAILFILAPVLLYAGKQQTPKKPNVVFIIVDQWRAQATGYSGDKNAITPNLDRLAARSINVKNAISGMPVCTPYRASLMTGQYPLTHRVFMNDVMLDTTKTTIAKVYKNSGYTTGFIGKWHIDGHGRSSYIPETRHQGFEYWKALECTHNYNQSAYYEGNSDKKLFWDGYDVIAQSNDASTYISEQAKKDKPFTLFLSLGPPHDPYQSAPEKYRSLYANKDMQINPNVPAEIREKVKQDLIGYYSHMTAIDDYIGKIWQTIQEAGIENNTIIVFTADHGDLLGAHGSWNKQQPYEESIRVPFLVHYPALFGTNGKTSPILLNSPDIMPTLLGLSGLPIPKSVEGVDFSGVLKGTKKDNITHTLISCVQPFGQWNRKRGGKEYRGIITTQYTYAKDLNGAWLLFDNGKDPFQLTNLAGNPDYADTQNKLEKLLQATLKQRKDEFKPGMEYVKQWNYVVDETETVPYNTVNFEGKKIIE
ncbi:sulfatase [Rhodocytophaga rosea]|uniref:Sulfatase n=2 Tax=Rhodocytophaga rosea TaxID=2704465 RepID=A0A6C0GX87_9BACT|nr:sulfatase [Rhodocytophaga rosea]